MTETSDQNTDSESAEEQAAKKAKQEATQELRELFEEVWFDFGVYYPPDVTYQEVKALLDKGATPTVRLGMGGATLLHMAVRYNWGPQAIDELLAAGVGINTHANDGSLALVDAASNPRRIDTAFYLLEKGADPTCLTGEGANALTAAAGSGHLRLVNRLLELNVPITPTLPPAQEEYEDLYIEVYSKSALTEAVEKRAHIRILARLIEKGAPLDFLSYPDKHSALTRALYARLGDHVRILMDAGADPYAESGTTRGNAWQHAAVWREGDAQNKNPMQWYRKAPELILETDEAASDAPELVLREKSDLFARNTHRLTLLDTPSTWHRWDEVMDALAKKGESVNLEDILDYNWEGKSWLRRGVECFSAEKLLGFLEKQGQFPTKAMLLSEARDGTTMFDSPVAWIYMDQLFEAARKAGTPVTKEDLLKPDRNGRTMFEKAVEGGKIAELVGYLNQRGERLKKEDFATLDGFFLSLAKFQDTPILFTSEQWHRRPVSELRMWYNAMPEICKTQVANYHQLLARLQAETRLGLTTPIGNAHALFVPRGFQK